MFSILNYQHNKELIPITLFAKDYGKSARAFNKLLSELKIQYKCGNTWALYQKYAAKDILILLQYKFLKKDLSLVLIGLKKVGNFYITFLKLTFLCYLILKINNLKKHQIEFNIKLNLVLLTFH